MLYDIKQSKHIPPDKLCQKTKQKKHPNDIKNARTMNFSVEN